MNTRPIHPILKLGHLLGVVAFLGGILACIVLNAAGHLGNPEQYALRRAIARDLTFSMIVPGMTALGLTGVARAALGGREMLRQGWVVAKGALLLLVAANGVFLLVPRVERIEALLHAEPPRVAEAGPIQTSEDRLGGLNLALGAVAIGLAIWRPSRRGGQVVREPR
jgi:hypothetical protein